jgi:hypothetical protein
MKLTKNISGAVRSALQWRLMLIWLCCTLLPTLIVSMPLWLTLSPMMDHSVHAPALAQELDLLALADIVNGLRLNAVALQSGAIAALAVTLLLSPFLSGVVVTAARHEGLASFKVLFAGGMAEYPRMLRMLLWAVVPLGVAAAVGGQVAEMAGEHASNAITHADARPWLIASTLLTAALLLLANATLDAGRATLAIDRRRTSAVKGWWRGLSLLRRRPGSTLGIYLALTLAGLVLAALLGLGRLHIPRVGVPGFIAALLVTQLIALVLGWMRAARLFAFVTLAGIVHKA